MNEMKTVKVCLILLNLKSGKTKKYKTKIISDEHLIVQRNFQNEVLYFCYAIQKFPIIMRNLEKSPECLQY
jgi:hypothetical protein